MERDQHIYRLRSSRPLQSLVDTVKRGSHRIERKPATEQVTFSSSLRLTNTHSILTTIEVFWYHVQNCRLWLNRDFQSLSYQSSHYRDDNEEEYEDNYSYDEQYDSNWPGHIDYDSDPETQRGMIDNCNDEDDDGEDTEGFW